VDRRRRSHPGRRDGGAAAVEFALVTPLLFVLLFGIIDYGIWFADSIALRQGVREAARSGVVTRFGEGCSPTRIPSASEEIQLLGCTTVNGTPTIAGDMYVNIQILDGVTGAATTTWTYGNTLRVCAVQQHDSLLPLVPLPDGGFLRSKVEMAIEAVPPGPGGGPAPESVSISGGAEALPAGASWSPWC
jgi:hypothetical protein